MPERTRRKSRGRPRAAVADRGQWTGSPYRGTPLDLDDALRRLEALDPGAARIVELRYFGGLTEQEAAVGAGVSVATVKRDWDFARTWLISQLKPGE
jgi:DNA-directed RNA polymerase specialized sigma24 family protein